MYHVGSQQYYLVFANNTQTVKLTFLNILQAAIDLFPDVPNLPPRERKFFGEEEEPDPEDHWADGRVPGVPGSTVRFHRLRADNIRALATIPDNSLVLCSDGTMFVNTQAGGLQAVGSIFLAVSTLCDGDPLTMPSSCSS